MRSRGQNWTDLTHFAISSKSFAAIKAAVAAANSSGVPSLVYIPAGTFELREQIALGTDVVLQGSGSATTTLDLNMIGSHYTAIVTTGGGSAGAWQNMAGTVPKGSTVFDVPDSSQFQVGGYAQIMASDYEQPEGIGWANDWQAVPAGANVQDYCGRAPSRASDTGNFQISNTSDQQSLLGNIFTLGTSQVLVDAGVSDTEIVRNYLSGGWQAGATIPHSYYLDAAPAFMTGQLWPVADTTPAACTNAAAQRPIGTTADP